MVKKRLASGAPCPKCVQAEELLQRRGLAARIDEVVWAVEGEPESAGFVLARRHGVETAPFFVVRDGDVERVHVSVLALIKAELDTPTTDTPAAPSVPELSVAEVDELRVRFATAEPWEVLRWGQERWGKALTLAFSGAEDVAVVDMAVKNGLPFSVFCLDTGRLHPETYRFIDRVRKHYGIDVDVVSPAHVAVEALVRQKGLYSFYDDGHEECCAVRKVEPLRRVLAKHRAWATGQRRDQSPSTRGRLEPLEVDAAHSGEAGALIKLNPLARYTLEGVWAYLREHEVPTNELHDRGFVSVGCEPCTRAVRPGEHERAGRWWWEEATKRECGLHIGK
jgi:phosphoadenosine phosphosulfate reductase